MSQDEFNMDEIDFNRKRGKGKQSSRRLSLIVIEGLIVLAIVIIAGRWLFTDNSEVSHLQATIDAQNAQPALNAQQLFERGVQEADEARYQDALRSFSLALELDSDLADAYFERGEVYQELEQYNNAVEDFDAAIRHDYSDPATAYYLMGLSHYGLDLFRYALNEFTSAIEFDDENPEYFYWRGLTRTQIGESQQAIDDLLYAVDLGYTELSYAYFFLANEYNHIEDYNNALYYYGKSITKSEDDCEASDCWIDFNNRGAVYYQLGDYEAAIKDYTRAIQVHPDEYPLALSNRGDAYNAKGDYNLALSDWNTMIQLYAGKIVTRSFVANSKVLGGEIDDYDTQVHVSFSGTAGEKITLKVEVDDDSSLNVMMMLRNAQGDPIAYASPSTANGAYLTDFVLPQTGTYTLAIASDQAQSMGGFTVRME